MDQHEFSHALAPCLAEWQRHNWVTLTTIQKVAKHHGAPADVEQQLMQAFNGSVWAQKTCRAAADAGNAAAQDTLVALTADGLDQVVLEPLADAACQMLQDQLDADPARFLKTQGVDHYPWRIKGQPHGYPTAWVHDRLRQSVDRFEAFAAARKSDTAILVGNGPSLKQMDLSQFQGQDVFLSNYAVGNAELSAVATGVGVSNPFVAEQEPHVFHLTPLWRFYPFWLSHTLADNDKTVWLNALGGEMFFSTDVRKAIGWHSTVTFFWLQILYSAGYRKVLLVGVDNSYVQKQELREGELIHQAQDDPNHFDPSYFKGKIWQAADTSRMEATYVLAKEAYEADGREIVNCGIGGKLELFRRAVLAEELGLTQTTTRQPHTDPFVRHAENHGDGGPLLLAMAQRLLLTPEVALTDLEKDGRLTRILAQYPQDDPRRIAFEQARQQAVLRVKPEAAVQVVSDGNSG